MFEAALNSNRRLWYFLPFAVIVLFYLPIFLVQGAWLVADHAEQHFPWANFLAESIKRGEFPIWTSQIQAGFPITGEGQIGAYYLPNLVFSFLLPIRLAYSWGICFHLILSAVFMTLYLRMFKLFPISVAFGVFIYMFGATLGGAYYNITSLKVLTWFPACLMIIELSLIRKKFSYLLALLLGVLFSLQLLVGYLQFAVYSMLFTGIYFLFRWYELRRFKLAHLIQGGFLLGVATAIAAGISLPQLLLTSELAHLSNRANPSEAFAYVGSYSPFALICFIYPSLEGLFISKMYLGILPLFFIIASICAFRTHVSKVPFYIAILALLLALGGYSPLYVGIVKFLKFYSFRTPVKFVFFLGFFLSVIAAYGMQVFVSSKDMKLIKRSLKAFALLMGLSFFGTLASHIIFKFFEPALYDLGEMLVEKYIHGKPGHPHGWEFYQAKLVGFIKYARDSLSPFNRIIYMPVLKIVLAVLFFAAIIARKIRSRLVGPLIFGLLIFDLNFTYNDIQGDYGSYDDFYKVHPISSYLQDNLGDARYFNYSENPAEAPLPAGKNMVWKLETLNAYSPLVMKDYYEFWGSAGGVNDSSGYHSIDDDVFLTSKLRLLGLFNAKYIVTDRFLNSERLVQEFQARGWRIYRNEMMLPKYQLIKKFNVQGDRKVILENLNGGVGDLSEELWLESFEGSYFGDDVKASGMNQIRVSEAMEGRYEFEVDLTENQFLSIAQTFYPGWHAKVDGQDADILRVNYLMSAIPIKKGRHRVVFQYDPI